MRQATPAHMESVREHFANRLGQQDLADLQRIAGKLTASKAQS